MIKASITINCPAEKLFDVSQDYGNRLRWDSFLSEARLVDASFPAVGARSFCRAWNGFGIESEYVTFKRPSIVAVKLTRGPWFFRELAETWRFQDEGSSTLITFIYHFKTRWLPTSLVGLVLSLELKRRLRDLKVYCESN